MKYIDIHSHILPGIDDGAGNFDESLEIATLAVRNGIGTMVATPHLKDGFYNPSRRNIQTKLAELKRRLKRVKIPLEVLPGMEVSLSHKILTRSEEEILTINANGKYLLVELPFQEIPIFAEDLLFQLQLKGMTPIIAHAERNQQIMENPALIAKFVGKGCLIQINAVSIAGPREDPIQQLCKKLLRQNLVHLIASDAHHPDERLTSLPEAIEVATKYVGPERVRELFVENPRKVIDGKVIPSR